MKPACASASNSAADIQFLIDKNADGILVVDEDGRVQFANPAAEQMFGRAVDELIGSVIGVPIVLGETTEVSVHRPGAGSVEAELRVVSTTWSERPARLISVRDISARRLEEERLRHAAKMEAVGRLTAGIAHDFNNILTVMIGNLDSAQRWSHGENLELSRVLENAMSSARRAAELTERLLAFARRKPLEPRAVDVNALVQRMSELLQRTLGESIAVNTVLTQELWSVQVDATELEAAVLNLAVNARDAMPRGGKLTISTANVEPSHEHTPEVSTESSVLIAISDTGIGMTPDVVTHAIEPFFTTKADGRGTGLGLSQVYGFVKQSGGEVRILSEVDQGTTVELYFPRSFDRPQAAAPAPKPNAAEAVPHARPGESVLLVEDNDAVRDFTVRSLRELGYRVLVAENAFDGLEMARDAPDLTLLVTDLGLPGGMDGKTLGARARELRPALKVLITTGYAGNTLIRDGRLEPGVELLNKPFTRAELALRVREVLDRSARSAPGLARDGAGRVLVVDDEPMLRELMIQLLDVPGLTVAEAGSLSEAIAMFRAAPDSFVAAIVDFRLPDGTGSELIGELRRARGDLPIVLATGYSADSVGAHLPAGDPLIRVLVKPFAPDQLVQILREMNLPLPSAGVDG